MSTPSRSLRILRVLIILFCVILGASSGVYLSALRITGKPQVFRSLAKLVAGGRVVPSNDGKSEALTDFYGTIIETIESAEMKRKASERVRALNPELKESDVQIRVAQTKGTGIINILATGSGPKYTQIFLNSLLDEFIAFRQAIREQAQGRVLSTFLQEVVNKQKAMEEARDEMEAAGRDATSILANIDLQRLEERLKALSNERDDLKLALRSTPPDAAEKEKRLGSLDFEIKRIQTELVTQEAAASKLRIATDKYNVAKEAYQKMFDRAETFQSMFNTQSDYVVIQERATTAAEHIEDWKLPILMGGGLGALAGLVVGLLISWLISALASSNTPPTPQSNS